MMASSIGYIASTPSIASISTIFITSDLMAGSFWDNKPLKKNKKTKAWKYYYYELFYINM